MRHFRSVDWALIGNVISGVFIIVAFVLWYFELLWGVLMAGVILGWWGSGIFWTFWIENNKEAPREVPL